MSHRPVSRGQKSVISTHGLPATYGNYHPIGAQVPPLQGAKECARRS
jgi:hypothetical protein